MSQGRLNHKFGAAQDFGQWHNQHRDRLLNSLTAIVRDREVAEEATSLGLATAWRNRNRFRGESSLYTWVHTIALNQARNSLRRQRALSLDAIDGPTPEALREPDTLAAAIEHSERSDRLRKALLQVPVPYRRALVDHFVRGYPVKEIARRNRIPVGTVLSRISTGKRLLRRAWDS